MRHFDPLGLLPLARDLVLLLVGVAGGVLAWLRARHAQSWPSTQGTVVGVTSRGIGGIYKPWIGDFSYTYIVNSEYFSRFHPIRASSRKRADALTLGWKACWLCAIHPPATKPRSCSTRISPAASWGTRKHPPTRYTTLVISTPQLHKRNLMRCDFDHANCLPTALPFGISTTANTKRWPVCGAPVSAGPQVGRKALPAEKQADRLNFSPRSTTTADRRRVRAGKQGFQYALSHCPSFNAGAPSCGCNLCRGAGRLPSDLRH